MSNNTKKGLILQIPHIPVLLNEVIDVFSDIDSGYIVDCTVGYGGHSEAILKSNPNINLICIDQDKEAIEFSKKRLAPYKNRVKFINKKFSKAVEEIKGYDLRGVLADIGVSSLQLDKKDRGFGFDSDVLDMRMNQESDLSAYEVVNHYPQSELERIFRDYGEIKSYKKLANLIVSERLKKPFESAKELSAFIARNMGFSKLHPATLPFQAIRIEVNKELDELKNLLKNLKNLNNFNLLVAIISFHSLEDKIVKATFKKWSQNCICPSGVLRCECGNNNSLGKVVTKKPIIPTGEEIDKNPRSRSSKLRVFRFC